MHFIKSFPRLFVATLAAAALFLPPVATAAGQCKGMPQDACAAAADCLWINSYVRKDGRSVNGHCKSRASRKSAEQASLDAVKLGRSK